MINLHNVLQIMLYKGDLEKNKLGTCSERAHDLTMFQE